MTENDRFDRQPQKIPRPTAGRGGTEASGDAAGPGKGSRTGERADPAVAAGGRTRHGSGAGTEPDLRSEVPFDIRPDAPSNARSDLRSDTAVVEIKTRVSAVRNLRDGLVQLVHWLSEQPGVRGYLLLVDPLLRRELLEKELNELQAAMRPEVAERLHLVVARRGQLERGGPLGLDAQGIPDDDRKLLGQGLARASDRKTRLPSPRKREEVLWVLLERWVRRAGPVKAVRLASLAGCNYRTVAAAVEEIRPALAEHSDRQIELLRFPEAAWRKSLAVQQKARAPRRYAFPSGASRPSEEALIEALKALRRNDIAVGGLLGARRHHPGLGGSSVPWLELCVHAPQTSVDLDFVTQLDASLRPCDDRRRGPADVVLRFVRRREMLFSPDAYGVLRADPIECLLGLYEAGLATEAAAFEAHLQTQGDAAMPAWRLGGRDSSSDRGPGIPHSREGSSPQTTRSQQAISTQKRNE